MLGTRLTQEYRVECDRCGDPAPWAPDVEAARDRAFVGGYRTERWEYDRCPRELTLCEECARKWHLEGEGKVQPEKVT